MAFGQWCHFVIKEIEKLVYFVESQGFLSLFQIAYKAQTDTRFQRKFLLGHAVLFT